MWQWSGVKHICQAGSEKTSTGSNKGALNPPITADIARASGKVRSEGLFSRSILQGQESMNMPKLHWSTQQHVSGIFNELSLTGLHNRQT